MTIMRAYETMLLLTGAEVMARLFHRRDDIRRDHDDFYEALPYQQRLVYDDTAPHAIAPPNAADRLAQLTYAVVAAVEALLALRFLLQLLGANIGNGIVQLIYNLSYPLVQPFIGMFDTTIDGVRSFSTATLVAMAVYALLGWVVISIINAFRNREVY